MSALSPAPVPEPAPRAGREDGRTTRRPWRGFAPGAARALVLFAVIRVAGLAGLAAVNHRRGRPLLAGLAHSWDSEWYLHIAEHGYGTRFRIIPPGLVQTDWAFFPLYPGLIRTFDTVLPVTPGTAAVLIAWGAAVVAAYGIYLIGRHLHGPAVATALVALWAVLPHAVLLGIAYTESLFTALAAISLYALLKGRWLWAGSLAALAGLSRPSGFAVAAAITAAAGHELVRRRGRVPPSLWLGTALAPLGWIAYVLWVGEQTGDLFGGYFRTQDAWDSRIDLGARSLIFLKALVLHGGKVVYPMALVIVAASVLLFLLLCVDREPLALVVFAGVLVLLVVVGSGPFASKPRFLVPAFPLLLPPARSLARAWRVRPARAVVVGAGLAVTSVLYGAYLVALVHTPL